jgi:hypothetical protein
VRHRAKLVGLRTNLKCQVHAVLAGAGIAVLASDLFGPGGRGLLERVGLPAAMRAKVNSAVRLIDAIDFEIDTFAGLVTARLHADPGYAAVQTIPGVGPILGAVFVAEIGEVRRFRRAEQLASWAGLTPRHHESDTRVHRGRITKMGCGGRGGGFRSRVAESAGGCRAGRGWHRYPSGPVDVRLRGSRLWGGGARPDRPGRPGAPAAVAAAVRRPGSGGVCAGGLHWLAVCRRGAGSGGDRRACRRAGRDRGSAWAQASGQD